MMKRIHALIWIGVLCLGLLLYNLVASRFQVAPAHTSPPQPQVRFLNDDPSRQEAWEKIAAEYAQATGIPVTVIPANQTAAAAPTLFTLHNKAELEQWKDRCLDLSGTAVYNQLASWDLTLRADQKVCGIAYDIEAFGLITNNALLARAGYSLSKITSLAELSQAATNINANRDALGFAAFACPDLQGDMAAHLASIPADTRAFLDLYINNSTCLPSELGQKNGQDSLEDFLAEKAVFYLASTDGYENLAGLDLGILPIFLDTEVDGIPCLCAAATSYWCVPNDASPQDIQATLDFLAYLVTRREDGSVPVDELKLLAPYRQATDSANRLEAQLRQNLASGKEWLVCTPVDDLPTAYTEALLAYAASPNDSNWEKVLSALASHSSSEALSVWQKSGAIGKICPNPSKCN